MRKKYLSALLFGAFLFASTGTFTSCKDYDDDIESLRQEQASQQTALDDLEALENQVNQALSDAQEAKSNAEEALNKVNSGEGTEGLDEETVKQLISDAEEKLQGQIDKLTTLEDVKSEIQALKDELNKGGVTAAGLKEINEKIVTLQQQVTIIVGDRLSSLVFQPDFYYQGIEAIGVYSFNYNKLTTKKIDADGNYADDEPIVGNATAVTPDLVAYYHMNPSNVDWKKITELTYITDDKNYTRAGGVVKADVYDWEGEKGILTVKSHLTDGTIKDIEKDGKVTVMALQAHYADSKGDTIITSDYAAIKAVNAHNIVLAKAQPYDVENYHLHTTAQAAINNSEPFMEIAWNSDGVNLSQLFNTHFDEVQNDGTDSHKELDQYAGDGKAEDRGFKYSYELVGYHVGDNKTSESAHAQIGGENGCTFRPQMTKDGKQQAYGAEQNRAEIGREPLVRVTLTDTISNNIVAVGYAKFKIVSTPAASENEVILNVNFDFDERYTVDCSVNEEKFDLSWHQVEEQIIAQLEAQGISKQEFHDDFTLDGGIGDATQYTNTTVDATPVATKIGTVTQTAGDVNPTETQVLHWTIKNNNAYQVFKNNASAKAIVRYTREVRTGVYQYIYISFTWTPSQRNVTPSGTVADSDKIKSYWYAKNGAVAGSGYEDIHVNVTPVGVAESSVGEFKSDILNTFVGNDVTVSGVSSVYAAFTDDKLTKEFVFVDPQEARLTPVTGLSGKIYDITISSDGKTLYAAPKGELSEPVVKITGSTLEYQNTDFAKDILNYADHNELGDKETFTAQIQINAENCDYVPFELSNNKFYAKFLRPVTVADPGETNFVDAETGGSQADVILSFVDWRDHNFDDSSVTKGENYYAYYGIKAIECLDSDITTDLNSTPGNFADKLSAITNNIRFEYTEPTTAEIQNGVYGRTHYFGTLEYINNNTTVGDFQIKVPFNVVYDWGTVRVDVICKIAGTEAN